MKKYCLEWPVMGSFINLTASKLGSTNSFHIVPVLKAFQNNNGFLLFFTLYFFPDVGPLTSVIYVKP